MTPHAFIAAHIVDVAPSAAADAGAWQLFKRSIAYWLADVDRCGIGAVAVGIGYCPACASEGSTLVGDVDQPCRECVPVADPMTAYKEEIEQ